LLQISHRNIETKICTRINILTQLFWKTVPEKIQCGKTGAAREVFIIQQFFSTTGCQTGLPTNWKNSPALLPIPASTRLTSVWLSDPQCQPLLDCVSLGPLCVTHAGEVNDCAVSWWLCVYLECPTSASPASVLISSGWSRLSVLYLLPPDCSPDH